MAKQFIERRILIGLIISTEYIQRLRKVWSSKYLQSKVAKQISTWCIEFFDEYKTAPGKEIESIFEKKTKDLESDEKEFIEDLLVTLSDEFERADKFNVAYLIDQTKEYFDEQGLKDFVDDITNKLDRGQIVEARVVAGEFSSLIGSLSKDLEMSSPEALDVVEAAFTSALVPVVHYPNQLGDFLNAELVRGGFVSFMGPEKRGKTFLLLDLAVRASRQRANVAFFQAGDMTEEQQVRRMCIHLAKKSDQERYSGVMYEPVRDCIHNQMNTCELKQRECDFGPFEDKSEKAIRKELLFTDIIEVVKANKKYAPCHNCKKYWDSKWGAVWYKKVDTGKPLHVEKAKKVIQDFFIDNKRRFKVSTHATKTLTVTEINNILDLWEREEGFVADLIIVDYADILAPEINAEMRHQENDKWMKLRGLSQKKHALVVTATQTDANSYNVDTLSLNNYSEDKRKFAHVTAMFGLNQDRSGREKDLGILRINEIVIREAAFSKSSQVYVLQNLKRGQPCLASYW